MIVILKGFFAYGLDEKTLMANATNSEKISVLHLAHKIYFHYQNTKGELPKVGSKEEAEYIKHRLKIKVRYDFKKTASGGINFLKIVSKENHCS